MQFILPCFDIFFSGSIITYVFLLSFIFTIIFKLIRGG